MSKKKTQFVKFRHKVVYTLLRPIFKLYFKIAYNFKYQKYTGEKDVLILSNHVTTLDPFFLATSFDFPIYYVASDQILNLGFTSKIIKYLVCPISKTKGISDLQTIKDIVTVSKEGGAVGLFPEGNRTFTGYLCTIPPQIGKLIKLLKKTVVIYNLENAYLSKPRFAKSVRKGSMEGVIKKVLKYQDYKDMTAEEIYALLVENLQVDPFSEKATAHKSRESANYLENVLYLCPNCHKIHTMRSVNNAYICKNCGYTVVYNSYGKFETPDEKLYFETVKEWFDYENNYIYNEDFLLNKIEIPIIKGENFKFYQSFKGKERKPLDYGTLSLFSDRIEVEGKQITELKLDQIQDIAPQTMGKIQVYMNNGDTYILIGSPTSYALSYVIMFYQIRNIKNNDPQGFIGV